MPKSPQLRFLLRVTGALAVALALWFLLLMDPILEGLRATTALAIRLLPGDGRVAHATIQPDGDWLMQLPVPDSIAHLDSVQMIMGRVSKDAPMVKVRSLKAPVPGRFPTLFTVSLPFFWALSAAAPKSAGFWRGLLAGTAVLSAGAVASLIYFSIRIALFTMNLTPGGLGGLAMTVGYFGALNVMPYMAPPLVALCCYDGLRGLIFSGEETGVLTAAAAVGEPKAAAKAPRGGRGKYRG